MDESEIEARIRRELEEKMREEMDELRRKNEETESLRAKLEAQKRAEARERELLAEAARKAILDNEKREADRRAEEERDRLEAERDSMQLYGEDISPAAYEVLLSDRDRGTYGTRLLRSFKTGLGAKFPAEALDKLTLAPDGEGSHIDGGLILRCGAVETNCTLSMLLAQNRRETEARVNQILFGDET